MILVHHFLRDSAERSPDKAAILAEGQAHTFAWLEAQSGRLASALQDAGLAHGDRVALFMENAADLIASIFGVLKAGGVFVAINATTRAGKLAYLLDDCGARFLIARRALASVVRKAASQAPALQTIFWAGPTRQMPEGGRSLEEVLGEPRGTLRQPRLIDDDLAAIIYTSGSTGTPKGVMLTHRNMVNSAWAISTYLENVPADVVLCALPLSFSYGLFQVMVGVRVGYSVVLERSFAFPYAVLQRMAEHCVTGLPGVPTTFATLLGMASFNGAVLPSLRYLTNAGANIPPAHLRRLREAFPAARIFSMYGLTECTRVSYLDPARLDDKIGSVGKAMPNCEAYVVDEEGRRVGPDVVGELAVRGANVMRGYWGNADETRRRLRDGDTPGERVLYTGDLFRMDKDGFLYFVGRKDDVFKCKGEKVSPAEVERVLCELPGVAEAAVIGVDDPIDGKAVKAFVVLRDGVALLEPQIRRHCRANLDPYMVPKFIEICQGLPKTDSGKIHKNALTSENASQW